MVYVRVLRRRVVAPDDDILYLADMDLASLGYLREEAARR